MDPTDPNRAAASQSNGHSGDHATNGNGVNPNPTPSTSSSGISLLTTPDHEAEWGSNPVDHVPATDGADDHVQQQQQQQQQRVQQQQQHEYLQLQQEMQRYGVTPGQVSANANGQVSCSSDGEFSTIARNEVKQMGGLFGAVVALEDIKMEQIVVPPNQIHQLQQQQQQQQQHGVFDPLYNMDSAVSPDVSVSAATGENPSMTDWPGEMCFSVRVAPAVKSKDAHYSARLNKLFINQNRAVQIMFNVRPASASADPSSCAPQQQQQNYTGVEGLKIRAVAVYTRADDFPNPVSVCHTHSRNSEGQLKCPNAEHLIRCTASTLGTVYSTNPQSQRHSVLSDVPDLQPGCSEVCLGYKFMDLGSCAGGLNRRDTAVIFTLEWNGTVVGRRLLPVRICTCPKRDMETEEKTNRKNISTVQQREPNGDFTLQGRVKVEPREEQEELWVLARGRKNFDALLTVGRILEDSRPGGDTASYDEAVNARNNLVRAGGVGKKRKIVDAIKQQQQQPPPPK